MTSAKQPILLPILLAVIFLFCGSLSFGQQYARIKLKNNTYLKGNIVQGIDSTGVILLINGVTSRIPMNKIENIKFQPNKKTNTSSQNDENHRIENGNYAQFEPGYYHSVGVGIISGNDYSDFSASVINGYSFHPLLNAGVGLNYNRYENITTLPLYAEYRGYPKKLKLAPYFFSQLGYGFRVENSSNNGFESYDSRGGLYWGAGVGYQANFLETTIALSVGYSNQETHTKFDSPQYYWGASTFEYSEKRNMGRIDVKLNFIF